MISKSTFARWTGLVLAVATSALGSELPRFHTGMCDASAAVSVGPGQFLVANDEDNVLRAYRAEQTGPPIFQADLTEFLKVDSEHPESDVEGAARLNRLVYWITSHGRNKDGKFRSSRHRFFATQVLPGQDSSRIRLMPEGQPYLHLLHDLLGDPRLEPFGLSAASRRAPKSPDALNIEGLSATPEHQLLIGFRNPIPQGKALLVPMLNPQAVIQGNPARFGEPILLHLDGLGIRDITWHDNQYYIVGGAYDGRGGSRLYRWPGRGRPAEPCLPFNFQDFNPEAIVTYATIPSRLLLLSDDGTVLIEGEECKSAKNPAARRFRSHWFSVMTD